MRLYNKDGSERCVNTSRSLTQNLLPTGRAGTMVATSPHLTTAERLAAGSARDANGCLVWQRATFGARGYGAIWSDGKTVGAHRVSFELANGPIPDGMLIRHKCDNRRCVEPTHLELGDYRENAQDSVIRGRKPLGAYHGCAKLSDGAVAEIRSMYAAGGITQYQLAAMFGCTQAHISLLVRWELRREVLSVAPVTAFRHVPSAA